MISRQIKIRRFSWVWLCSVLSFISAAVFGQTDSSSLITADFKEATISEFLNKVEEESSVRFFYDPVNFDSVRITLHANHLPLRELLDQAFKGTDIFYTADEEGHLFLTRGNGIDFSFTSRVIRVYLSLPSLPATEKSFSTSNKRQRFSAAAFQTSVIPDSNLSLFIASSKSSRFFFCSSISFF